MDDSEKCDVCGGELEVEYHYKRRELVCKDCGAILDHDYFGEEMEPQESDMEVME
jgi:transcription initiation factor TFIIIB Brf1 subunit/transcription initiation factor TFIIB